MSAVQPAPTTRSKPARKAKQAQHRHHAATLNLIQRALRFLQQEQGGGLTVTFYREELAHLVRVTECTVSEVLTMFKQNDWIRRVRHGSTGGPPSYEPTPSLYELTPTFPYVGVFKPAARKLFREISRWNPLTSRQLSILWDIAQHANHERRVRKADPIEMQTRLEVTGIWGTLHKLNDGRRIRVEWEPCPTGNLGYRIVGLQLADSSGRFATASPWPKNRHGQTQDKILKIIESDTDEQGWFIGLNALTRKVDGHIRDVQTVLCALEKKNLIDIDNSGDWHPHIKTNLPNRYRSLRKYPKQAQIAPTDAKVQSANRPASRFGSQGDGNDGKANSAVGTSLGARILGRGVFLKQ
jgi:hypothetical protein